MRTLAFKQLPLIVKIAVGVVFNNAWWSIEEFVIDRKGLWKYMPYYRVGNGCVWDLAVAVITTLGICYASTRREIPDHAFSSEPGKRYSWIDPGA